jgi:hypothetical protein
MPTDVESEVTRLTGIEKRFQLINSTMTGSICASLIVAIAILVTIFDLPGLIIADARLEHLLNPRQFLFRHSSIWDDSRGAGAPTIFYSPFISSLQSVLDLIRIPPWLIGRLTLAAYLSIAGIGAMRLANHIYDKQTWMGGASGILYAFCPYSFNFLLPSGLFVSAAILPWLVLFTFRGLANNTWRYPASIALLLASVGALNTASLLYSLVPVGLLAISFIVIEKRYTWRSLRMFLTRTFFLSVGTCAAAILVLITSAPSTARNLLTTELPEVVARTTTASESWRGLGFWLSYFNVGQVARAQSGIFVTSAPFIALSFVVPLCTLVAIGHRVRFWRTWSLIIGATVFVMVGSNTVTFTPLSRSIAWLLENILPLRAFRSTYKAGAILALAMAIIAPQGIVVSAKSILKKRDQLTMHFRATAASFMVILGIGVYPFLAGPFNKAETYRTLPAYWNQLIDTLTQFPDERILVVPGLSRNRYEWGYINDNIFDSLDGPSALFSQTLPSTMPDVQNIIDEFNERITSGRMSPGAVAPLMRQLGARLLLVQNDLRMTEVAKVSVDNFPGLRVVGNYGGYLTLYELDGKDPTEARWSSNSPLIVSGGEGVLSPIAELGWLDQSSVNFSALNGEQLAVLIDSGSEILVADGSQRRVTRLGRQRVNSLVLSDGDTSERPVLLTSPKDLTSQSILEFNHFDVRTFGGSGDPDFWNPNSHRGLLFDPNADETGWFIERPYNPVGATVVLNFNRPTKVSKVQVQQDSDDSALISQVLVTTNSEHGTTTKYVVLSPGINNIEISQNVTELSLEITAVSGTGSSYGFTDLKVFEGTVELNPAPYIRLPTESKSVERLGTPVSFLFSRLIDSSERILRRQFTTSQDQVFHLEGVIESLKNDETRDCVPLLEIDGRKIFVRPKSGTWARASKSLEIEGCRSIQLSVGPHVLEESFSDSTSISSLTIIDQRSQRLRGPLNPFTTPIDDTRLSAYEHSISLPPGSGFLTTTTPRHPSWSFDATSRSAESLQGFGKTVWWVSDGSQTTATIYFQTQRLYEVALYISGASVIVCLILLTRKGRT